MKFFSKAVNIVAACMLALVTMQLAACDLLLSEECDSALQTQDQNTDHQQPPCDSCLCCCAHVTGATVFVLPQETVAISAAPTEVELQPLSSPSSIEHPPQLS
jgi:hypothetical protein